MPALIKWWRAKKKPDNRKKAKNLIKAFGSLGGLAKEIARRIKERQLNLLPIKRFMRKDGANGKIRELGCASQMQQAMGYVAVYALMPLFKAKMGVHQYASVPKRGQIAGVKRIKRWVKRDDGSCKYYDKMDIRHCFESIKQDVVRKFLARDIGKNKTLQWFVNSLIATHGKGLIIGSYLSQWLANYIMSYAYHYLHERCYKIRRAKRKKLVTHVLFYMDDMVVFSKSKRDIKLASKKLVRFLANIGLVVKPNHNYRPLESDALDVMGFVIHSNGKITIRSKNFIKARRMLLRPLCLRRASRFMSYYGFFKYSDCAKVKIKYNLAGYHNKARRLLSKEAKQCYM